MFLQSRLKNSIFEIHVFKINTFEDIHSKNKQFIGNVVEIETNCQEKCVFEM